mgnify:FL=1
MATKKKTAKTTVKPAKAYGGSVGGRVTHVEPVVREVPNKLDLSAVQAAIETLRSAESFYLASCSTIEDGGEMSQDLVAIAAFADTAKGTLARIYKAFEVTSERLRATKGRFAAGRLQVVFEFLKGKRSVAWKDEATARAAELAKLRGEDLWDEKKYQEGVLSLTAPGPGSYSPKIQARA